MRTRATVSEGAYDEEDIGKGTYHTDPGRSSRPTGGLL